MGLKVKFDVKQPLIAWRQLSVAQKNQSGDGNYTYQ